MIRRSPLLVRRVVAHRGWLVSDHPVCRSRVGSADFLLMRQPPLLTRRGTYDGANTAPQASMTATVRKGVMSKASRIGLMVICWIVVFLAAAVAPFAQGPADNPYRPVKGLAEGGGRSVPGGEW